MLKPYIYGHASAGEDIKKTSETLHFFRQSHSLLLLKSKPTSLENNGRSLLCNITKLWFYTTFSIQYDAYVISLRNHSNF
jgi:hypothetical protein